MRLSTFFSLGYAAAAAAAMQGAVYIPSKSSGQQTDSVPELSPSNARLYIAQRLGLSGFHSVVDADDATIELLSKSSTSQRPLFSAQDEGEKRRTFLMIDGESEQRIKSFYSGWQKVARLSQSPSHEANVALVGELLSMDEQKRQRTNDPCEFVAGGVRRFGNVVGGTNGAKAGLDCFLALRDANAMSWRTSLINWGSNFNDVDVVDIYHIDVSADSANAAKNVEATLASLTKSSRDITVIALPKNSRSKSRSGDWKQSNLGKRQESEEVIAPSRPSKPSKKPNHSAPGLLDSTASPNATMGKCASSEDDCIARSNNCSGRGSCKLAVKATKNQCWSCECSPTKETWGTQYWGGAACQKRDISLQFWLFAGFSVAAVSLVTWGIGLLYSMGESELPSVLSAGVAPTNRK